MGCIPLFIPLLAYEDPKRDLIEKHLTITCRIKDENQLEWIKQQPILLILDGFDEMHVKINLYRTNELWKFKNLKVIISCRSQWLATVEDYRTLFYPLNNQEDPLKQSLQELVVSPFNSTQIEKYLQKYVTIFQEKIKEQNIPSTMIESNWTDWKTYQDYQKNVFLSVGV